MTAAMDSPDRNPIVPSTDCQGSPFFHFLCSLSPIKAVRSGYGTQTFSELSCPPPPAVFVSPKAESRKDSAPPRRKTLVQLTHDNEQERTEECNVRAAERSSSELLCGSNKEICSRRPVVNSVRHDTSVEQERKQCQQESIGPGSNEKTLKASFDEPLTEHLTFQYKQEKSLDQGLLCQSTTENKDEASKLSVHDLERWSIAVNYPSNILASVDLTSAKDDVTANLNLDCPPANVQSSNLHGNEEVQGEYEGRGCRATTLGSVGLRRCLDFENSEMWHKTLDSLPMLRMIGLSCDNPTRIGFSTTAPFSGLHGLQHPSSNSNVWDHSMPTGHSMGEVPRPYAKIPNSSHISAYHTAPLCENPPVTNKGLSFRKDMAGTTLQASELGQHSLPAMANLRSDGQERSYNQAELSSNLDQELLRSLAERTNQQHQKMVNNAAHVGLHMPIAFHQPVALGFNGIQTGINRGELENISTALVEKVALLQESSHQSESDHLEDSTCSPRSPRKKRKFSIQTGDNGGESCKNCKCKKSKCLKLYCECFAAGVYCIDICNCNDCYNKPEFEEMVLGTRQQIESRNPLAFVPKIIRASESSPTIRDECNETPASARHKRGCNCKKSQCLKKYCECYQAGVGCADGCRCEGCRNIYGRNEGSGELEDKEQQADALQLKHTLMDTRNDIELKVTPQQLVEQKSTDLTPITPYLENSGLGRSDLELASIERSTSPFAHPISSLTFQSPSKLLELLDNTEDFCPANIQHYLQATCASAVRDTNDLPHGWNGQLEIYAPTPTPTSQPLQQLTQVVADVVSNRGDSPQSFDESLSYIKNFMPGLKKRETNQLSFMQQLVPLDFPPNPSELQPSENTIAIPVTPLLPTTTYSTRPSFVDMSESSRHHQSAWLTDEDDDSPNVLKELNTFCAPDVVMKTRSPQQKRIFSYQHNAAKDMHPKSRTTGPGMTSWSGRRKFILHSLPTTGYEDKPRDNV